MKKYNTNLFGQKLNVSQAIDSNAEGKGTITRNIGENANGTFNVSNTQRIIDVLNNHWNNELRQKYNDVRTELSQQRQSAYLISQLKPTSTTTAAA